MAKGDLSTTTAAWRSLNLYLPTRTHDEDYWWQKSGPQLAALVEGAGYTLAKQYEALLFHYHWMVPYMGPSPLPEGAARQWKSLLQPDGTPIEYSWKWNTTKSPPDIRYDIEPIGPLAGTKVDPLNQHALREMLHRLADQVPNVDLTWSDHFFNTLFDHDLSKYVAEAAAGKQPTTSGVIAAEFLESGTRFKTYFQPRKLGYPGLIPMTIWDEALEPIDPQGSARAMVKDFLENTDVGKTLNCFSVAVDVIKPEKSRLKWYFNTPSTAFSTVREVLTLGGRVKSPHQQQQLSDLFELVKTVQALPDDFPEDKDVPFVNHRQSDNVAADTAPAVMPGYVFYFDIAPGNPTPNIKFALPLINFGREDLALAEAITGWMKAHGRGEYCDRYITAVQKMAMGRSLRETKGLQSFVAALFLPNGEIDVTTYFAPAALNAPLQSKTNTADGIENGAEIVEGSGVTHGSTTGVTNGSTNGEANGSTNGEANGAH